MSTPNLTVYPPEVRTLLDEALRQALTGQGKPEVLERIAVEAQRVREEVLQANGVIDVGAPAIRELRDKV